MSSPGFSSASDIGVLVADDDDDIRAVMRDVLEDSGYSVLEARDGAEALACLRESPQELVAVLDQIMPRHTGIEVVRLAMEDRRLARRHAYIICTASPRVLAVQMM